MFPTVCATKGHADMPVAVIVDGIAMCRDCLVAWTRKRKAERLAKPKRRSP